MTLIQHVLQHKSLVVFPSSVGELSSCVTRKLVGLTTAAGIWATSGIGMAIGGGLWFFGLVCSVFVMLIQWLTHDFTKQHQIYQASINGTVGDISLVHDIYQYCDLKQYQIANVDVKDIGGKYEINIQIENDKQISIDDIEQPSGSDISTSRLRK